MKTQSHMTLLILSALAVTSCGKDMIQATDTGLEGAPAQQVSTEIPESRFGDTLMICASSSPEGPGSASLDHLLIDGKRVAYSLPLSFAGPFLRDTAFVKADISQKQFHTGTHEAEFHVSCGEDTDCRSIKFTILPSEDLDISAAGLFVSDNTNYSGATGLVEDTDGRLELHLGVTNRLYLSTAAANRAAAGLYDENFTLSLDSGEDIAITGHKVTWMKYYLPEEGYQTYQGYFLDVSLMPLRGNGTSDSLRIRFWDRERTVALKTVN